MSETVSKVAKARASKLCQEGLAHYRNWDIEQAIQTFEAAIALDHTSTDLFLHLAQAHMRMNDYDCMRKALGEFIHLETDPVLLDRFEAFFGSGLDQVEVILTQIMTGHEVPLEVVGAAIHMWIEFKLAMGRNPINMAGLKPKAWAAALDYAIRKINFHEATPATVAEWYSISPKAVEQHYTWLVETLDLMPCDYRYFRGPKNPLDKLVEAAIILEELEQRFYKTG